MLLPSDLPVSMNMPVHNVAYGGIIDLEAESADSAIAACEDARVSRRDSQSIMGY